MDTQEKENVSQICIFLQFCGLDHGCTQGLNGDVVFSGSTPDLDEFTVRIVDGRTQRDTDSTFFSSHS